MPAHVSAVINVKNNADELARCLKSLTFVDEIVVVDMESDDESVNVAKQFDARIFSHPDVGYADPARNFAIEKATSEWVLVIDADEEVPNTLAHTVAEILKQPNADVYWLPRVNLLFGTWAKYGGWWPDYQPRLFKKGAVSWQVGVHRLPNITGTEVRLPAVVENALIHYNYENVEQFIAKLNRYTTIQAKERSVTMTAPQAASDIINHFKAEFFRRLFHDQGIKGGIHGTGLALLQSSYEIVIAMKMWQNTQPIKPITLQTTESNAAELDKTIATLLTFERELRYWLADVKVKNTTGLTKVYWQIRRKFRW